MGGIILFVASVAVAFAVPLLKRHWLKRMTWASTVVGIAISLIWGGYEFGVRQAPVNKGAVQGNSEMSTAAKQGTVEHNLRESLKERQNESETLREALHRTQADLGACRT
jgi:hypothetical protein